MISWNILRGAAEVIRNDTSSQIPKLTRYSQLGITKVVQASSVNVVSLVWSVKPKLHYLPLDEDHPREDGGIEASL